MKVYISSLESEVNEKTKNINEKNREIKKL